MLLVFLSKSRASFQVSTALFMEVAYSPPSVSRFEVFHGCSRSCMHLRGLILQVWPPNSEAELSLMIAFERL